MLKVRGVATSNAALGIFGSIIATVLFAALVVESFQLPLVTRADFRFQHRYDSLSRKTATRSGEGSDQSGKIAFIVDRIEGRAEELIGSVSDMCIEVFFNKEGNLTPWKGLQLAYLRRMQYSDLRFRSLGATSKPGYMFVAREVVPVRSEAEVTEDDLISDENSIQNVDVSNGEIRGWTRGDVLGFVEITEKRFGLGEEYDGADDDTFESQRSGDASNANEVCSEEKVKLGKTSGLGSDGSTVRPFLSNLSVREDARRSGVGSALVESCEEAVLTWPDKQYTEIVLQVEQDNPSAQLFYEKRGYDVLFADPACRRFDTTGFILRQVPTTKVAMRKDFSKNRANSRNQKATSTTSSRFDPSDFFGRLRDAVFAAN
mmetsp:Transcript_11492/g.33870  ORF Transcript_11492/g.33870 Transcript_11492/m.33870 type:complete len:374 (-) Transcript_11492:108-1229(-)